jgi:rhamnosyltransferase
LAAIRRPGPLTAPKPGFAKPIFSSRPRILLVSPYKLWPADHGGGVRCFNLVRRLSDHCGLHLLIFNQEGEDEAQREALSPYCVSVSFHHWKPRYCPNRWGIVPPNAQLFQSRIVGQRIRDITLTEAIDIVQLEYTELGQYIEAVPDGIPVILTEHDIAFRSQLRRRQLHFHRRFPEGNAFGESQTDWRRLVAYELKWNRRADQIHTMSVNDGQFLSRFLRDKTTRIRVAPNGVDTRAFTPPDDQTKRQDVLYVGNFQNLPNIDALEYLLTDIWPLLRLQVPEAKLIIVGANPTERVFRFHGKHGVEVVGRVPSIEGYYHRHQVLAVPIRAGSGTRLKIMEAFAAGIPVVSTTLGAEGIAYKDGEHLVIADGAVDFARALARVLEDNDLADSLSQSGLDLARSLYDWDLVETEILHGYRGLIDGRSKAPSRPPLDRQGIELNDPKPEADPDVSVIIPTLNGGSKLAATLAALKNQETNIEFEVLCIDSQSDEATLTIMQDNGARIIGIERKDFDHGLTRDLGVRKARGKILAFLNQDAMPAGPYWLEDLCRPLLDSDPDLVAIQGSIREFDDPELRFFWDSCGPRFYFTHESGDWIEKHGGIGFSTVNCAIRRETLERIPFGFTPMMEDKKWQQDIARRHLRIEERATATVYHSHNYDLRGLVRRCVSEGFGWSLIGIDYQFQTMLSDLWNPSMWRATFRGVRQGQIRKVAEVVFPLVRPVTLYWGNHFARDVSFGD